ncbi:MAG: ComFC, amidophosphoribosyltransferase [Candidatus Berkelbacteria bacterium]|nr:ComFC, amidophosphoribosyltransferase [Candidatus Berkelbacteria bacterium]
MFYNIKNFVLDLIFPKFCLGCQKEGTWVCPKCAQEILLVKSQVCPDCGRISKFGKYCLKHQKPHGLTGVLVAAYYEEGPLKELIHNFKYNHILEVGDFLGELLVEALSNNLTTGQDMIITAVPLNFWRQSQRGYNQSEVLAKYVANRLNENQSEPRF